MTGDLFRIEGENTEIGADLFNQFSAIGLEFELRYEFGGYTVFVDPDDFAKLLGSGELELLANPKRNSDEGGDT